MRSYKMKQFKKILVCTFAFYFFMAGVGVNVVNYCCDQCASIGVEALVDRSCAVIHSPHSYKNDTDNKYTQDSKGFHYSNECSILRLNTDIPSIQKSVFQSDLTLNSFQLFVDLLTNLTNIMSFEQGIKTISPVRDSLLLSGRIILAIKSVLII